MKKILLTGGGTAGHIFPLLAIYQYLRQKYKLRFVYFGEVRGMEERIAKRENIPYVPIIAGKIRPYFSFLNFSAPLKVICGFFQALFRIIKEKPDFVLAKGGYVTIPTVLAAFVLGKKIFIHESDSVMGRSNRILYPFAKVVFVAFPKKYFAREYQKKMVFSGLPVRKEFFSPHFFPKKEKIILVFGGSQGAKKINELVLQALPALLPRFKLIHITGEKHFEEIRAIREKMAKKLKDAYQVFAFVEKEMASLLKSADLVISRAGATSIFEIAAAERPAVLIPYPYAANDHQTKNASILQSQGAAVMFREEELSGEILGKNLIKILSDDSFLRKLSFSISKLKPEGAEKIIAEVMLGESNNQKSNLASRQSDPSSDPSAGGRKQNKRLKFKKGLKDSLRGLRRSLRF